MSMLFSQFITPALSPAVSTSLFSTGLINIPFYIIYQEFFIYLFVDGHLGASIFWIL